MADGSFVVRINDMGEAFAAFIDVENTVIAGSGKRTVVQRDDNLRIAALDDIGLLDTDAPRFAARVLPLPCNSPPISTVIILNAVFSSSPATLSTPKPLAIEDKSNRLWGGFCSRKRNLCLVSK